MQIVVYAKNPAARVEVWRGSTKQVSQIPEKGARIMARKTAKDGVQRTSQFWIVERVDG